MSLGATRFIEKPVDLVTFLPIVEKILKQGAQTMPTPLDEVAFYEGYRKRLETKLAQKSTQIARDERLLETLIGEEKATFTKSLQDTIAEREELQKLLIEIRQRLEERARPE